MNSLLIVDDEIFTVDIIKSQFCWEELGIDEVYTAYSMNQAVKVLEQYPVDVMICDIEMGTHSGLELLEWVRKHHLPVVSFFLTGHAQFDYCRRAIELGSIDYVLKPIEFDKLREIILTAVARAEEQKAKAKYQQQSENWLQSSKNLLTQFWSDIISETIAPDREIILHKAGLRGISMEPESRYLLLLSHWNQPEDAAERWGKTDLRYALNNMATDLLEGLVTATSVLTGGVGDGGRLCGVSHLLPAVGEKIRPFAAEPSAVSHPVFFGGVAMVLLGMPSINLAANYVTLFVQSGMGYSATFSGTFALPKTLFVLLVTVVLGGWISRRAHQHKMFLILGGCITAASSFLLYFGTQGPHLVSIIVLYLVTSLYGIGEGLCYMTTHPYYQKDIPEEDIGSGISVQTLCTTMGATLSATSYGAVLNGFGGDVDVAFPYMGLVVVAATAVYLLLGIFFVRFGPAEK